MKRYVIKVRSRYFPCWKTYRCAAYKTEIIGQGCSPRLVLTLSEGGLSIIPHADQRRLEIFETSTPSEVPDGAEVHSTANG